MTDPYASLAGELKTGFIGKRLIYYSRLSSTMDAARAEAARGAPEGTVILAGEQSGGRGRLRRAWFTPPGNIALSIILHPDLASLPYLVMATSLAVAASIKMTAGPEAGIKWPNDVIIDGKKVAGILIENEVRAGKVAFAVAGIGINVGLRPGDVREISGIATSLAEICGREVSSREVLRGLLEEFERLYVQLPEGRAVFEAWRARLVTLGKPVTARWGESIVDGIADSVDESGALTIRRSDGSLARVVAGDVTLS